MWPLNYSATSLLLVLDHVRDSSRATALCNKALNATCTLVDFAPAAAVPSLEAVALSSAAMQQQQQQNQQQQQSGIIAGHERPAAAIFATINGGVSMLWSPFDDASSTTRNGARIRDIVKERLQRLLSPSSAKSNNREMTATTSRSISPTLQGLIQCTGILSQLSGGGGGKQKLPCLIRVFCEWETSNSSSNNTVVDDGNRNRSLLVHWKDSLCALLSTWQQLNVRVTIEGGGAGGMSPSCPVLSYLLAVGNNNDSNSSSVVIDKQPQKQDNENKNHHHALVFVCPRCRAMETPPASSSSSSSLSSSGGGGLLRVLAMHEAPLCPRGCAAVVR